MTDDITGEIGKLHQHIDHVSNQIRNVQTGQDELHAEHQRLRERMDNLERSVSRDIDNLASHEREAELYRSHMAEGLDRLTKSVDQLDARFGRHTEAESKDRKEVIRGQQITIRSILLAAVTFATSAGVLLWQTGVLQ